MAQLISVRSNQDFGLNYQTKELIPQTEIIILVEKPVYITRGKKIIKDTTIEEMRFKCGTTGLNQLIGQLQAAHRNVTHFEKMAGVLNEILINETYPEGDVVK